MKKNYFKILILLLGIGLFLNPANAQKLGDFGSSTEKKVGPKTIKVPYTDVISYLGYAEVGSEDEIIDGKKFTFLYLWIPAVAPEIGVRMMSPVGETEIKDAIKAPNYDENAASEDYFDTYITLERTLSIAEPEDITEENVAAAKWIKLAYNDDSGEMPKNPGGNSYNSLLRYESEASNPEKALTRGLYRIGFTTYKVGEVKGTFLAQVGAPVKLPGVAIAKTIEDLLEQINK
ncbi:MAG: hypothetical protein JXB17_10195 [Bacteroidales bacterium]|nr:hypothetical protein [Bacteroidales bacterium]